MSWFSETKARWDQVKAEYGKIALFTYLTLWALVLGAYFLAIALGMEVEGAGATGSAIVGSWVAAKVTQPARIALTIVLTPMVARVLRKGPIQVEPGEE